MESTKTTCGSIKFGSGYVKSAKREKQDLGEPSPGPGSYVIHGGINQSTSGFNYKNSPKATMSGRTKFGSPFGP